MNEDEFAWDELSESVRMMSMGKSPGMDGISTEMLKRVWVAVPGFMKGMYDSCLNEAIFPR